MSNLKVGMRVVAVTDYPEDSYNKRITCGDFGTITGSIDPLIEVKFDGKGSEAIYPWRVEPVTEEPKQMFNIKTDPWFIRVNSEQESKVIQDWLFEQGIMWIRSSAQHKYTEYTFILNVFREGSISKHLLRTNEACEIHPTAKEIKLTFKTTVDSVEYPVVETEHQIKMKQLQETIDKAARELKELREMGEKK